MSDDSNLSPGEKVSRVLKRVDPSKCADRPERDEDDFLRRREFGPDRKPENGISLTRRRQSTQDIYDRFCTRRIKKNRTEFVEQHLGLATCTVQALKDAGLKTLCTPANPEHVSLRCNDCDTADLNDSAATCAPRDQTQRCPLLEPMDPLGLVDIFGNDAGPSLRKHSKAP